jgi:hypothetical protein
MIENTILVIGIILISLYFIVPDNKITRKINSISKEIKLLYKNYYFFFPLRCLYLFGRITIAIIAQYGLYITLNTLTTEVYQINDLEISYTNIFIFEQFIWIIPLYIFYDIFTTIYTIFRDIKNKFRK